ncbi:MAG TPA: sulfatase [Actinomycetota bacterium]|nr:sulfatase [Actinomycetota bacterium]
MTRQLALLVPLVLVACTAEPIVPHDNSSDEAGRPNILLVVTDDQRDGTMSMMPDVERWFGTGGTRYENAFATTPVCCPARASILTGLYAHNHGILTTREHPDVLASAEPLMVQRALRDDGYRTALFGKYLNNWPNERDPANFDRWATTPFIAFGGEEWNVNGVVQEVTQNSTSFIGDLSISFLRDHEQDDARPWFLDVAFMAPHLPATVEPRYLDVVVPPLEPTPAMLEVDRSDKPGYVRRRHLRSLDDIQLRRVPALRSLVAVDDQVDRIMRVLQELGELQNTIAIFVSDNGYLWGEHGRSKKAAPYLPAIEVPLYVRWPGHVAAGGIDTRLVGSLDIGPTIFAAAGVEPPSAVDGRSLLDRAFDRDRLLLESWRISDEPPWTAVLTTSSIYVEYASDRTKEVMFREFYRLRGDPDQLVNLLHDGHDANDPNVARFAAVLERLRSCAGADCPG